MAKVTNVTKELERGTPMPSTAWRTCPVNFKFCLCEESLRVEGALDRLPKLPGSYNPGQKVLGHLPFFTWFCMEFAANLRYTLINTALTRFFPHP